MTIFVNQYYCQYLIAVIGYAVYVMQKHLFQSSNKNKFLKKLIGQQAIGLFPKQGNEWVLVLISN